MFSENNQSSVSAKDHYDKSIFQLKKAKGKQLEPTSSYRE